MLIIQNGGLADLSIELCSVSSLNTGLNLNISSYSVMKRSSVNFQASNNVDFLAIRSS